MNRLFRVIKQKRNVRRLLAAGFLLIAFVEMGSHAFMDSRDRDASGALTWCAIFHYTNPGIDCPHKRDHRGPDKSVFDESSHHAVLLTREDLEFAGIAYQTELPAARDAWPLSCSLTPPFYPPKQA